MPEGLQILKADGSFELDTTTRVGRFLGSFSTGGASSGSLTDGRLIGKGFFSYFAADGGNHGGPVVTCNPSTGKIDWEFNVTTPPGSEFTPPSLTIYYGAY